MNPFQKLSINSKSKIAFLSIKPIYAKKLLIGIKRYEFRKRFIPKDLTHIVIYATNPIKRVVGVGLVDCVIEGSPTAIWELAKSQSGISRNVFRTYFKGKSKAYAIKLNKVIGFSPFLDPKEINGDFTIPQSLTYIDSDFVKKLTHLENLKRAEDKIIFLGGVHGVGKSTIGFQISTQTGFKHIIASELIKKNKGKVVINKQVEDISGNQELLLLSLNELCRQTNRKILFDGHFTLWDVKGKVKEIPLETFERISPCMICVLVDDPKEIVRRLKERDLHCFSERKINGMQKRELRYAREISKSLKVKFIEVSLSEADTLVQLIKSNLDI